MINDIYKKYTLQAKRGIKGESFFESLVSDYCLPHQIVGPKDLGIDYICEWIYGDKPTGVLFAVQIKTFSEETAIPNLVDKNDRLNQLEKYEIKNSNFKKINEKTLYYWKGLGIPVYLFAICINSNGDLDCYYKRLTASLTKDIDMETFNCYSDFFKVNDGNLFRAYKDPEKKIGGFARDLFIDYIRWNYYKGSIAYLSPRDMGLEQFPEDNIFPELFDEYKDKIIPTYLKTRSYLEYLINPTKKEKQRGQVFIRDRI